MASIKGKGTLYKNPYGWSISQVKKDQQGKNQIFFIPVKFIKNAISRVEDRKFIEFEGFTNHYKTKDGKTMTDYVITHIQDVESNIQGWEIKTSIDYDSYDDVQNHENHQSSNNVKDDDQPILDISSDDLPF